MRWVLGISLSMNEMGVRTFSNTKEYSTSNKYIFFLKWLCLSIDIDLELGRFRFWIARLQDAKLFFEFWILNFNEIPKRKRNPVRVCKALKSTKGLCKNKNSYKIMH